jgi:hypothetical protein
MTSAQPSPPPDGEQQPEVVEPKVDVSERWWWTGAVRGVLGGAVVGYQVPVILSGDALVWNWLMAALGAGVVVWAVWLLWTAYVASRTDG